MASAIAEKRAKKASPKAARAKKGRAGVPARTADRDGTSRPLTPLGIKTKISALGAGAYEAYQELDAMFQHEKQNKLSFWWNIGKRFNAIKDQWEEEGLTTFCKTLGENVAEVRLAMQAATLWTEDQIIAIVAEAHKNNASVTWSHIRLLLAAELADGPRDKYLALIQKERMGYEEMVSRIRAERDLKGKGRGKTGGRPYKIPATFDGLYRASVDRDTQFLRFCTQIGDKLTPALAKIDEGRFDAQLLVRVRSMREQCDKTLQAIRHRADTLVDFERKVEQKLGLQPEPEPEPEFEPESAGIDGAPAVPAPVPVKKTIRKPPSAARKKG